MELRTTREMRRSEQLGKALSKKAETADAPAQAKPSQPKAPADKVSISRQALSWLDEQNQRMWEQDARRAPDRQDKSGELELLEKGLDVLDKCTKIAAAIMRGDKVPPEDLKYLMENDSNGYKLAMALRREKKDPEEVESVLDKEGENGPAEEPGGDAPAPEASGGGEASTSAEL